MPTLHAWEALKAGNGCPFDGERSESNEHWDKIATLAVSTLYLHRIQTYRGYCVLVFDPRHVTSLGELSEAERNAFISDVCRAQEGMRRVLRPDHFNVECLGNQVPHLHWHIVPRYKVDGRWGLPIWTTTEAELIRTELAPANRAALIGDLKRAIAV
jgi:diadenosine tetraphosphate (Ap4A) HIT family hydrolase